MSHQTSLGDILGIREYIAELANKAYQAQDRCDPDGRDWQYHEGQIDLAHDILAALENQTEPKTQISALEC
jgi:hypothetical protein